MVRHCSKKCVTGVSQSINYNKPALYGDSRDLLVVSDTPETDHTAAS